MTDEFITIHVRAKIYHVFQYRIMKKKFIKLTVDEIINEVKTYMKNFFTNPHDLPILREGIDKLEFHMHDDIPYNRPIIYLCDSSHGMEEP